ncbi:MAG TPA: ABC transporter permease [Methylomirabilota bacterium]|jgi:peptide/nickel transport system permease protein|nr:ABC transporter permease [Methylomirabilota bacterium]
MARTEPARPAERPGRRPRPRRLAAAVGRLARHRLALTGLILVVVEIAIALLAPWLAPSDPSAIDYRAMLAGPSHAHLLGTDDLGRDLLSRLMHGARVSLGVGVTSVLLAVGAGVPLGLVTGYLGGKVDEGLMRLLDSVMALPALVLALTIAAVLGLGLINGMIAIAIVLVPIFTRLVRGQVLSVKHNDYVQAAHALGLPTRVVLARHILPNVVNPVIVQASLGVGFAIIIESSLSFIGLGAQPPTPAWGSMVQTGFQYLEIAPWFVLAPATMIFLAVLGFNMLGDGLRDLLDPMARSRL